MTDKEKYREQIIKELFDKRIVVAIVNQHAYQWSVPNETEVCEDAVQQVFLALSRMDYDKLIELYEHDKKLYKLKNYIGSIVKTACFGMRKDKITAPSYSLANKIFLGSMLKGGVDSMAYSDIWEDEEYTEENIYTEMWREKVLPRLTEDEKDFLKLWFAISRKPKTTKIKVMYEVLCKKIKRIVNDQPLVKTHTKTKLRYKLSDEEKESLLFSEHGLTGRGSNRQGQTIPVFQCSLDGVVIKRYNNAKEASKETGVNVTNISRVARGLAKTAGGFLWRYEESDSETP